MEPEPRELSEARELLGKFEQLENDPSGLPYLKRGLKLLCETIEGSQSDRDKRIARNILGTHRSKVLSRAKLLLSNPKSYELETLEHWHRVMKAFTDSGFDDDPKFNAARDDLFTVWLRLWFHSLSPWQQQELLKELRSQSKEQRANGS